MLRRLPFRDHRRALTGPRRSLDHGGADALELLESAQLGRVIFTEAAMLAGHPVNYLFDGEEIAFPRGGGAMRGVSSWTMDGRVGGCSAAEDRFGRSNPRTAEAARARSTRVRAHAESMTWPAR